MERSGYPQPDVLAGSFRKQQAQDPGTAKDKRHQQSAVSCRQVPYKSPPPPHQQPASPEMLQALAIVYKMMLEQHDHSRIIASITGTTAAWDAIYNDRFAEEDARLKSECQRLLGLQRNTTGDHSSPESAFYLTEQSISDVLQVERGRRPYPVDQESTVALHRRTRSAEGGHPQPQLNTKADSIVEAEIPDYPVSQPSCMDTLSIAQNSIDDVTSSVHASQLESSTQVAHSVVLCSGVSRSLTMARSDNSTTGGPRHATSFNIPAAKRGCLPCSVNTQASKSAKTTRSHRLRLRPKTRWKTTLSARPSSSLHDRFFVAVPLSSVSVQASTINKTSGDKHQHTTENIIRSPAVQHQLGPSTMINIKQHLQVSVHLLETHQRYFQYFDLL